MDSKLDGLHVAILATDGFEQSELLEPRKALDSAGATTEVISPKGTEIKRVESRRLGPEGRRGSDAGASRRRGVRCAGTARGRDEPGRPAHEPRRRCVRQSVLRCRQTGGGHLSWSLDRGGSR